MDYDREPKNGTAIVSLDRDVEVAARRLVTSEKNDPRALDIYNKLLQDKSDNLFRRLVENTEQILSYKS